MTGHILVVEDERSIADAVAYALETEGLSCTWVGLGQEAIDLLQREPAELVILDVGLPDLNGFDVCRAVRQFSDVPIIFLTARKDEIDRVVGLEIGADDYVVKPFSPRELAARVKAVLRRRSSPDPGRGQDGPFDVDLVKRRVSYRGKILDLTRYEYGLLVALHKQPGRIFSREQLMDLVWDAPEASLDRTVDAHIKSLRSKLREITPDVDVIRTHRGMGYSLEF